MLEAHLANDDIGLIVRAQAGDLVRPYLANPVIVAALFEFVVIVAIVLLVLNRR